MDTEETSFAVVFGIVFAVCLAGLIYICTSGTI